MTQPMMPCGCTVLHGPRNGCPPGWLVDRARAYVEASEWTFAKTMKDNPHHYVVRQRAWAASTEAGQGHEALFELIRFFYYLRWWQGRGYRSIDLDGYSYWIMQDGTVINRKPIESAGWDSESR